MPTLRELGYDIVAMSPYGLAGPRGLPRRGGADAARRLQEGDVRPAHIAELAKYDQELAYLGPDDYAQVMRDTYQAERRVVERLGLARAN